MKGMSNAVNRILKAINENEKILVFGDYDVDGTTAVALFYSFIRDTYSNIDFYIPDRYAEGYGISFAGIDYAQKNNCKLIVALDCGIKSVDKVDYAKKKRELTLLSVTTTCQERYYQTQLQFLTQNN